MENKKITLLFDFDGVVCDTETQYTIFWNKIGKEYLNMDNFGIKIKGQTLKNIRKNNFNSTDINFNKIESSLNDFEANMEYEYIPGLLEFVESLDSNFNTAIVTSSNKMKMAIALKKHPELKKIFNKIFTSENIINSKPNPECYVKAMTHFKAVANNTIIFEDSFSGLKAAVKSKAIVVGLATTNATEEIINKSDIVIENFKNFDIQKVIKIRQ